jgi:ring-1,2-phenylacetyl-CoA epoxidase subunit PaaC
VLDAATLLEDDQASKLNTVFMQLGGKNGVHTEQMGFILAELQYLQRTYPGANW